MRKTKITLASLLAAFTLTLTGCIPPVVVGNICGNGIGGPC
ncbi:hypothetical protein [Mycolicibacterium moriokaense]|nr:hypothetical protein [Mycolicibacterium moriokaense]